MLCKNPIPANTQNKQTYIYIYRYIYSYIILFIGYNYGVVLHLYDIYAYVWMFSFLICQSRLLNYPNELCSLPQFHFTFHQQSNVHELPNTVKDAIWLVCWIFGIVHLYFYFSQNFSKPQLRFVVKSTTSL